MKFSFERWGETLLGAAVVVVAAGFFAFASAQGGHKTNAGGYDLVALFDNASSVNVGSDVRMSGVKIGVVKSMTLDPETFRARVTLTLNSDVHVLDQSTARITADGLLGGGYVAIEPAGMDPLRPGAQIPNTQGYVDLLTVLSSAASGLSSANGQNHAETPH